MDEWSKEDGAEAETARPLRLRAKLAVAGIVVYTALYVVLGAIVVTAPTQEEVDVMSDAELDELDAFNARVAFLQDEALVTAIEFGFRLLAGVFFWMWMYRAYDNVRALGHKPDHLPERAIWCWLVPFANLVWPYQVMSEIWRKSGAHMDSDPLTDDEPFTVGVPPLLGAWWGLWILRFVLDRIVGQADAPETLFGAYVLVTMVDAGLAIAVVSRLTARQENALARSGSALAPSTF